ncbi:MAG: hypothetical protein R3C56_17630 [Pirellulaceae bacterium]
MVHILLHALAIPQISNLRRPHASLSGVSQVLRIEHEGNIPALPLSHPLATSGGSDESEGGNGEGLELYSKLAHLRDKLAGGEKKLRSTTLAHPQDKLAGARKVA